MTDFWRRLSESPIDVDRVVAGLHNVELLEGMSNYPQRRPPYFPHVAAAIDQLPREHWDAALAVFGAVIYVPKVFMDEAMRYLWWALRTTAERRGTQVSPAATDLHLLEVDSDSLVPDFARVNALSARLNAAVHSKLNEVQKLRAAVAGLRSRSAAERDFSRGQLRLIGQKKAWLVLTDKALSGQSLVGDLQRIAFTRELVAECVGSRPQLYVGAQIMTSSAETAVAAWARESNVEDLTVLSAIRLDERARVGSPECALFDSRRTHDAVLALCDWFDAEVVARDASLNRFREHSDGSLALGYKQTGLTLADAKNTPTNSLPLLWFDSTDPDAIYEREPYPYVGPFPRTHSRRGEEQPKLSEGALWRELLDPAARDELLAALTA